RAVWRPRPSLATAAETWLMAGGPHHTALTTALDIEAIQDFADIADIELVKIDASTTPYDFKRELRWNQAYYFLNPWPQRWPSPPRPPRPLPPPSRPRVRRARCGRFRRR